MNTNIHGTERPEQVDYPRRVQCESAKSFMNTARCVDQCNTSRNVELRIITPVYVENMHQKISLRRYIALVRVLCILFQFVAMIRCRGYGVHSGQLPSACSKFSTTPATILKQQHAAKRYRRSASRQDNASLARLLSAR